MREGNSVGKAGREVIPIKEGEELGAWGQCVVMCPTPETRLWKLW